MIQFPCLGRLGEERAACEGERFDMNKPLHFVQTSIRTTNYFTFQLPVSAFGFHDDMVMEVSVEYWRSVDQTHDLAHVWARQARAHSKHLVHVVSVPASERPAEEAIFEALNDSQEFEHQMCDYIEEAAKHRVD